MDADEQKALGPLIAFQHFVGDAGQSPTHGRLIQHLNFVHPLHYYTPPLLRPFLGTKKLLAVPWQEVPTRAPRTIQSSPGFMCTCDGSLPTSQDRIKGTLSINLAYS